eukprot:gene4931-9832_t
MSDEEFRMSFAVNVYKNEHPRDKVHSLIFTMKPEEPIRETVDKFCAGHNVLSRSCDDVMDRVLEHHEKYTDITRIRTVAVIVGTRPDAIKLALLIKNLRRWGNIIKVVVINTGQHREILDPVFKLFNISADMDLGLMSHSQAGLASFVTAAINTLDNAFKTFSPPLDLVIVQGDTNTALAGALAAFYQKIPVAHVEAGLRTWDLDAPYPEEMNRRVVDMLSVLCLAPTEVAKQALLRDGVMISNIAVVGNTVIDTVEHVLKLNLTSQEVSLLDSLPLTLPTNTGGHKHKHIIVSTHRRESFGPGIEAITQAVAELADRHRSRTFLFLVHPNPAVAGPVRRALVDIPNVVLVDPVEYSPFLRILATADLVISDSGGMQEEAAYLGVPCIVLRDKTERSEGVLAGVARLVPPEKALIVEAVNKELSRPRGRFGRSLVYGDGHAVVRSSCRIAAYLRLDTRRCQGDPMKDWMYTPPVPHIPRTVPPQDADLLLSQLQSHPLGESSYPYFHPYSRPGSITVILTQYRRNTTEAQLRAVFAQTALSAIDAVLVFQNEDHVSLSFLEDLRLELPDSPPIQVVQSKHRNFKFHGRFALPLLFDSEYTVIFDDDTIPQSGWIAHAVDSSRTYNAIVGAVGMIVAPDSQSFLVAPIDFPLEVDYVGHSWVFRTEWTKYLWNEHVPSWECCEDIGFSAAAWLHGRIKTIIPAMPYGNYSVWGDSVRHHHKDGKESFTRSVPAKMRWPVTRFWVERGWVPAALRNTLLGPGSTCASPLPGLCQAAYDMMFREKLRAMKHRHRHNSQHTLSSYITAVFDPVTYVYEEKWPPEAEENARQVAAAATATEIETVQEEDTSTSNNKPSKSKNKSKKNKKNNKDKKKRGSRAPREL